MEDRTQEFLAFCRTRPQHETYSPDSVFTDFGLSKLNAHNYQNLGIPFATYRVTVMEGPLTYGALAQRLETLNG